MGYKTVAKELGIDYSVVRRWVKHFKAEGIKGLEEKCGKAKGPGVGRPENPGAKVRRLETKNEMLKRLLGIQKE